MGMRELVDILQTGGPWGLLAIAAFVCRHFYLEMRAKDEAHRAELRALDKEHRAEIQQLNDRVVATVQAQVALLQESNANAQQLITALAAFEEGR